MILRKIHVESFGRLKDFDADLTEGLNVIMHENGWGKSTLAAFIRVMFFGFDNEKKRNEIDNERRRFSPWAGGGAYGGYLIFETEGKKYRLERYFDKNGDTFQLYNADTNLISADYSENIGEELFGIDRNSFSKTVFVAQQSCRTEVTSEISAKIGNVSEEIADMARFEEACKKLQDKQNNLSPRRATGLIKKLNNEVAELKNRTRLKDSYEKSLDEIDKALTELRNKTREKKEKRELLHRERNELSSYNALKAEKNSYDALVEEKKKAEKGCDELKKALGDKIPELKKLDEMISLCSRIQEMESNLEKDRISEEEKAEYDKLKILFKDGIPGEEELDGLKSRIEEIQKKKEQIAESGVSAEEKRKLEELELKFGEDAVESFVIADHINAWRKRESILNMLPVYRANESSLALKLRSDAEAKQAEQERIQKEEYEQKRRRAQSIIIAGAVCMAAAVLLYFVLRQWLIPAVLLLAGAVTLIPGIAGRRKTIQPSPADLEDWEASPLLKQARDELESSEKKAAEIEERIAKFLGRFGTEYREESVQAELYGLQRDLEEYKQLSGRIGGNKEKQAAINESIEKLSEEVKAFAGRYFDETEVLSPELYYKLQEMAQRYGVLKEKTEKNRSAMERLREEQDKKKDFLREYMLEDKDSADELNPVREKIVLYESRKADLKEREAKLAEYEKEHDISKLGEMKEPEISLSADELTEKISELELSMDRDKETEEGYRKQKEEYEDKLEEISEINDRIRKKEEELEKAEKYYDVISKTESFLREAKENFLKHFLEPMQSAFDKYYTMLSGDTEDVYDLDVNFNVKKRELGQLRDPDLLSEGYKDMVGLCRRMAMIDAMYEKEAPVLIFDDPFVNLDDEKLKYGIDFLKAVGSEYQIIYTTCHSSRGINGF